ncbi:MAG: DUF2203 family protein [Dehalococcoidia bacterium]|nr:DUF2203 family protein [Dehalococcoidia bacterium]
MDYFTLEQAIALLPWLRDRLAELDALMQRRAAVQAQADQLQERLRSNGHTSHAEEVGALQTELQQVTSQLEAVMKVITDRGITLRDPQRGLVDFLALRNGREVCLCWLKGEDTIRFWHEMDSGFAGRKPL